MSFLRSTRRLPADRRLFSTRVTTRFEHNGQLAHVQLTRSDKLNALDMPMFQGITAAAKDLQTNKKVRCVILSGEGRAFCTGLDVQSVFGSSPLVNARKLLDKDAGAVSNLAQDVAYQWRQVPVPVICVIHGMCYGGGLQIALGADVRIATADARLSIMETKWGLIPDMSASVTLRELVRADVAKELTWTGRIVQGEEAAALGLVTKTAIDYESAMAEAERLAKLILERSPDAVARAKRLYQETWVADEATCLQTETDLQRQLLAGWNQIAASSRNFGVPLPYRGRKDEEQGK